MLLAAALLAILPVLVIGSAATVISSQGLREKAFESLGSVAVLKSNAIHEWLQVLQTNLSLAFENQVLRDGVAAILKHDEEHVVNQAQLRRQLSAFNDKTGYFIEVFVLDRDGKVILSTESAQEGKIHKNQGFFQNGLTGKFVSSPIYEVSLNTYSITFSQPIQSDNGAVIGVLAARANIARLSEIMEQETGLGEFGETYLVSSNFAALTAVKNTDFELGKTYIRTQGVNGAIASRADGSAVYVDYAGNRVLGVYRWVPELQVALIAEHQERDALAPSTTVLQTSIVLILVVSLIAFTIAFLFVRSITGPVTELVNVANRVTDGNFELLADVSRKDEIGVLAQAFNAMIGQLREFIDTLEQRVDERTRALTTVAEVSTAASTILETDRLLQQVVDLAKERFGFYHAHIYLLDEAGDTLMLSSGAGEIGRQMVAEGRSIPVDREQSLVARAAREKRGVTVNDVTTEPGFLSNPLLPDTHSELAVPMMIGEQVIGVFDVQSEVVGRFTDADIAVQTTLASQIASAVQNARLYTQAENAKQEAQTLVDYAAEAVLVFDLTTGLFTSANENAEKVYGLSHEELLKVGPAQMSPAKQPDGRDSNETALENIGIAMQKGSYSFEWVHINAQGVEFPCEIRLVRLPGDRPRLRVSVLDITERKHLQDLVAQRAHQQEAINLITQKIQGAITVEEALQVAAREVGHVLGGRETIVSLELPVMAIDSNKN
jgi:PAS domain S-box-containing protein